MAAVLSPWMTVEEAYLLASWLKGLSSEVRLARGHVRVAGEDDCYPKDVRGNALPNPKFTIRAEKCPNRAGVDLILNHFHGSVVPFDMLLQDVASEKIDTLYLVGGDPQGWITGEQSASLGRLKLLAVQDLLPSPALEKAHYVLAGASFAERDGTFVNHAGLCQAIVRGLRSPDDARADGRILWELTGRRGLFHAANLRREIGREVPALAALAGGDLGEYGLRLDERPVVAAPTEVLVAAT